MSPASSSRPTYNNSPESQAAYNHVVPLQGKGKGPFSVPRIAKNRIAENQRRIEAAALKLFTKQGFHGTNIREIAGKIGVSTGAIYTYYPSKEAIFESLVESYRARVNDWLMQTCAALKNPLSRNDLKTLA